jgi:hypothetical protein
MKLTRFSKKVVAVIIAANIVFTAAVLYIFFRTGSEPATLVISWFGSRRGSWGAGGAEAFGE